jgi:ABC-type multidrug transport system ATPase subunit
MTDASLQLMNLSKSYGARAAVCGISLDVRRGEILGLLGPNGAGKSTTINMLTGFLKPTSGDVLWNERSIFRGLDEWRRTIGVVLEDLSLFEYLTVEEHFALAGTLYGLSRAETERRAAELIEFLMLNGAEDTVAREASQGTRKKLAFGLGIIHRPEFLFLDEALNGIDALVVKDIKEILKRMSSRGMTVILSSHVLDAAENLIDRCVIISAGSVALDTPMTAIKAAGKSLEVTYAEIVRGNAESVPELSWLS